MCLFSGNELSELSASTFLPLTHFKSGFFPLVFKQFPKGHQWLPSRHNKWASSSSLILSMPSTETFPFFKKCFNSLDPMTLNIFLLFDPNFWWPISKLGNWVSPFYMVLDYALASATTCMLILFESLHSALTNSPLNMTHRNLNTSKTHSWSSLQSCLFFTDFLTSPNADNPVT